jgi:hypothetical protein
MRQWWAALGFPLFCWFIATPLVGLYVYAPMLGTTAICGLIGLASLGLGVYLLIKGEFLGVFVMLALVVGAGVIGFGLVAWWSGPSVQIAESIAGHEWLPIGFSALLVLVVSLIGIEWLTRKLLRLA